MSHPSVIQHEKDLVSITSKPVGLYKDRALTALTAYTLYWLHQWSLRRTIEAIAVLNWRLFPEKFAMVGFREYPDAFRTNRSLLQMQPKYRNLLTGAAVKGFSLNERGIALARDLIEAIGVPTTEAGEKLEEIKEHLPEAKSNREARSIEPEREMERLRSSKLFQKWKAGILSDRDLIHVHSLLGIFDHTPAKVRANAIKALEASAKDMADAEAQQFLSDVRKTFSSAFTG
jgi:hypothetical protein